MSTACFQHRFVSWHTTTLFCRNVIDVAALDSHNLEQHEYVDRARQYFAKAQAVQPALLSKYRSASKSTGLVLYTMVVSLKTFLFPYSCAKGYVCHRESTIGYTDQHRGLQHDDEEHIKGFTCHEWPPHRAQGRSCCTFRNSLTTVLHRSLFPPYFPLKKKLCETFTDNLTPEVCNSLLRVQ